MAETPKVNELILPIASLWRRELVRFIRQRSRVIGAFGTPLVFWLLLGSGLRNSFQSPGDGADSVNYLQYTFPGMVVLILLFTAIFSTISVIEDRQAGFMQAVLTAPVDRLAIVLGKVAGSTTLAIIQACLFLAMTPLVGLAWSVGSLLSTVAAMIVVSVGLSSLGFLLAWRMSSIQGFHAIMNLFLMPMWMLSGALFPAKGAAGWMSWVMAVNPLSYGLALVREAMTVGEVASYGVPSVWISLAVTIVFSAIMVALAGRAVKGGGG